MDNSMKERQNQKKEKHLPDGATLVPETEAGVDFRKYLRAANLGHIECVDERDIEDEPGQEYFVPAARDGVQIPGAVFGLVDAVKLFRQVTEEEAWKIVAEAGIPLTGHDDEHHEALGCGYEKLVEKTPKTVRAVESVAADDRMAKLRHEGGLVQRYLGHHQAKQAVINRIEGLTIDPEKGYEDDKYFFSCDSWVAKVYGPKLGIEAKVLQDHLEEVYMRTVMALTENQLKDFVVIEDK